MAIFVLVTVLYTLIYQVSLLRSHSLKSILDASQPDYTTDLENGDSGSINLEGRNAADKHTNFMVLLYYEGEYQCLATVISDRLVLTAAHCVKDDDDDELQDPGYFMGLTAGTKDGIQWPPLRFESIHVLPDSKKDDLAILVTRKIVAFGDGVGRICLSNDTSKELMHQNVVAVSDAGVIENDLKFSNVKVVSGSRCGIKGISRICAYGGNTTLCKSDSGGPLIATSKQDVHFQIGILLQGHTRNSTTHESTECSNLVRYNRVSHYSNFISQIANMRNTDVCFVKL